MKRRRTYPLQGSKKWKAQQKRKMYALVRLYNLVLQVRGHDAKIVVKLPANGPQDPLVLELLDWMLNHDAEEEFGESRDGGAPDARS